MAKFLSIGLKNPSITVNGFVHRFKDNILETEDEAIIKELRTNPMFTEIGTEVYNTVEPAENQSEEPIQEASVLFYKLPSRISVEDAKRYAEERGIPYPEDVVKQDLIEAINEYQKDKIENV